MSKKDKEQESFIGKVIGFIIVLIVLSLLQKACTPETLTPEEERLRRMLGMEKEEFMSFKQKLYETLTPEEERLRRTLGMEKEEFMSFKQKLYKEVDRINNN